MKKILMLMGLIGILFTSCEKDEENFTDTTSENNEENTTDISEELEIEDFVYRGLNEIYLYKAEVPELADSYFSSNSDKFEYLDNFSSPEELFETLIYDLDRFSFITDDYETLEEQFQGISGSTGIKYGIGQISGTSNIFGYIQYVLPGTSAEEAGLKRGNIFTEVNGQKLTTANFQNLINSNTITINVGEVQDGTIILSDRTVTLTDDPYTANPVYISKVLNIENRKIGYLMYNSFIGDFDDELNAAFAQLKAEGIDDLVLDLRYNGGGSVVSAIDLASMITGQFEGEVFMKEMWNEEYQAYFEENDPERIVNRFDSTIRTGEATNSLNLNKLYVLTTAATASASELVINGLDPYIDVVQIGTNTTGKFQASVTLYDSPDFSKEGRDEDHTYAMQPLVFKSINSAGRTDYIDGLDPDISYTEDLGNMGVLGDPEEPLLQAAIHNILGRAPLKQSQAAYKYNRLGESGMNEPGYQKMFIEDLPPILDPNS
ncbi:S41 family peptidase [Gramella sp. GC03-9]|uniref:S41 family peptidase n=1 Tax=Christiangramia oceanisediminis TaxID=2920386 RepID=A0A9X2KYR7_9FLAO|nr:S41 family peptidase [Gramella oceanisediminis]MCP9200719.1 S41 family peptidase [Gramella oceanisediminis]